MAVFLPPQTDADTKTALSQLYKEISKQETTHPEAALLVAGDFNAGKLKSVLPNFYQHIGDTALCRVPSFGWDVKRVS